MNIDRSSWIVGIARPFLAALAILTVLSLATPSASASIALSFSVKDLGNVPAPVVATPGTGGTVTSGSGTGTLSTSFNTSGGAWTVTILTMQTSDPTGTGSGGNGTTFSPTQSTLQSVTLDINNRAVNPGTLAISLSGQNFTVGAGGNDQAFFAISGTATGTHTATDQVTGYAFVNTGNTALPMTVPIGTVQGNNGLTGTVSGGSYQFPNLANSNFLSFANGGVFSLGEILNITIGAGDSAQITITTTATAVPEPSSMAIAGLGALGLIGYGLRRRKALGA